MNPHDLLCIVDDDESIRDSVAVLLRSNGFSACAFASAEALLTSATLSEVRCLIVDVSMPGMTGPELQRHLAATGRSIPIIFITAHKVPRLEQDLLRAGAVAFLAKPFREKALLEAIHRALGAREEAP